VTVVVVDEMNLKILRLLMTDGKMTDREVAQRLHRSPSTIRDRIRRLEDDNYILGYVAIVNSEHLGMSVEGVLFANLVDGVASEKLRALAKVQGVREVLQVTGRRRIMVRMVSTDNHSLEETIERQIVPLGLKDLELRIVMESVMRFPGL
jgi:Lrp/AsnC family leucine-responsive transcriptional regulator